MSMFPLDSDGAKTKDVSPAYSKRETHDGDIIGLNQESLATRGFQRFSPISFITIPGLILRP